MTLRGLMALIAWTSPREPPRPLAPRGLRPRALPLARGFLSGTITHMDTVKHSVTLGKGQSFHVAKHVKLVGYKVGEKVTLTYSKHGKTLAAKAIKVAP